MKKYISIILLLFIITSCGEDFITKRPENQVDADLALGTTDNLRVALNSVYQQLQDADYYGRYFVLVPDVMAEDVEQSVTNSNRMTLQFRWEVNANSGDAANFWNKAYNALLRDNSVVQAIDGASGDDAAKVQLRAEGLALRALVHFDLVRYFAQPYNFTNTDIAPGANGQGGHLGIPITLEPPLPDAKPARNTVKEVYDQVIADLKESISLFDDDNTNQIKMNKYSAMALLARVYLYQENWSGAETMAGNVISSGNYSLLSPGDYVASWDDLSPSSESIFEIAFTASEQLGTTSLGYMYAPSGYYDMLPTGDLDATLDAISNRAFDVRAQLWDTSVPVATKYKGPEATAGYENTVVLRLAEMYLIRAEARAEQGNFSGARSDLNALRAQRITQNSATAATDGGLLQAIYDERRIELAFEGHELWDFTRTGRDIVRDDCRLNNGNCTITYPDKRMAQPIPQRELDANANMVQNPGY